MKRLLALLVFVFGGISVEATTPAQCKLAHVSRPERRDEGMIG